MNSFVKSTRNIVLWALMILFILLSLLAALNWYSNQDIENVFLPSLNISFLALAAIMQILAIVAVLVAWYLNLRLQGLIGLRRTAVIMMVGISTVGKYTPGKVWGVFARGVLVYRYSESPKTAVATAVIEQTALLHSAAILTIGFFVAMRMSSSLGAILVIALLPSIWWVAKSERVFRNIAKKLKSKEAIDWSSTDISQFSDCYPAVCTTFMAMWVFVSAVLWFLVCAVGVDELPQIEMVFFASQLAYITGFAAFFAPAGIGVREGVVVAILSPVIGISAAVYVSLLQRLISVGVDIALGIIALYLSTTERIARM